MKNNTRDFSKLWTYWCSGLEQNCWRHLLCRWWVARGGRVCGTCPSWLHRLPSAPSPETPHAAHACLHRSHWRRCWMHHPHLPASYHLASARLAACATHDFSCNKKEAHQDHNPLLLLLTHCIIFSSSVRAANSSKLMNHDNHELLVST